MDLSAAAALCLWLLSACRPRHGLEAAAVPRAESPGRPRAAGWGSRNGSVVPHRFMVALYRSLAASAAASSSAGSGRGADTITGFADRATPGTRAPPRRPSPPRGEPLRSLAEAPAPQPPLRGGPGRRAPRPSREAGCAADPEKPEKPEEEGVWPREWRWPLLRG